MTEVIEKEFNEFFEQSPFSGEAKNYPQIKLAMYGAFMGGYGKALEKIIGKIKEK
jgi:hypothetical protein